MDGTIDNESLYLVRDPSITMAVNRTTNDSPVATASHDAGR